MAHYSISSAVAHTGLLLTLLLPASRADAAEVAAHARATLRLRGGPVIISGRHIAPGRSPADSPPPGSWLPPDRIEVKASGGDNGVSRWNLSLSALVSGPRPPKENGCFLATDLFPRGGTGVAVAYSTVAGKAPRGTRWITTSETAAADALDRESPARLVATIVPQL